MNAPSEHPALQPLLDPTMVFPADFVWGVATSATQIEGAAALDGRGESIWDRFCLTPGHIADGSSPRTSCDQYLRLEEDLDLIASLGVNAYRFSVSWPRVRPAGDGPWNEAGIAFYRRLVEGLHARGIQA
ncbi:MAG: family 1 glycosylhydrolase, partial [Betaproteobacteria bacterium]